MILCTISLINTRPDITAIWQWDNKNSNQRLIRNKDQNTCFWTFAVNFAIDCELTPQNVISACRNINQKKKHATHPTKYKKHLWNENIPYFLPVVYNEHWLSLVDDTVFGYTRDKLPDSKVHGVNMGPTGPRWARCWPHEFFCLEYYCQIIVLITPNADRQRDSITTRYSMYTYD